MSTENEINEALEAAYWRFDSLRTAHGGFMRDANLVKMAERDAFKAAVRGHGSIVIPATTPIPMLLWCPECSKRHIDVGEFETKPHHTHACQHCGHVWRLASGDRRDVRRAVPAGLQERGAIQVTDLPKLRALAEAATPGPWSEGTAGACNIVRFDGDDITGIGAAGPHNAAFIAAASPSVVLSLLDQLAAAQAECERLASDSLASHCEYKQRRNEQLAAYEFAHRATVAYLLDRAEQYDNSSGYRALFDELIDGIAKREHISNAETGEYDDLAKNVDRILGKRREASKTETERLQGEVANLRTQLAAVTAARDEACDGWERELDQSDFPHGTFATERRAEISSLRKAGGGR